jgi:hypothetical protein
MSSPASPHPVPAGLRGNLAIKQGQGSNSDGPPRQRGTAFAASAVMSRERRRNIKATVRIVNISDLLELRAEKLAEALYKSHVDAVSSPRHNVNSKLTTVSSPEQSLAETPLNLCLLRQQGPFRTAASAVARSDQRVSQVQEGKSRKREGHRRRG